MILAAKSLILDFASKKFAYNADKRPANSTIKIQRRAFDSAPSDVIIPYKEDTCKYFSLVT